MTLTLFLKILLIGAIGATAAAMGLGVFNMLKTGKDAGIRSNNLMRLRILFQGCAILIFSLLLFLKGH